MTATPRVLYVHDDLTALAAADDRVAHLARRLLDVVRREPRVRILTLAAQVEAIAAQGPYVPFETAVGIGAAGEAVARALHAETGWFPDIHRIEVTREETLDGGYALVTGGRGALTEQLARVRGRASIAVVDDTVFSGLTLGAVLRSLPDGTLMHTHGFCLRAVQVSLEPLRALCPVTAGFTAPGRLLDDVSFINASGLVRRGAIRRVGRPPLAFYERPEWMHAWFPRDADDVIARCAELARQLDS